MRLPNREISAEIETLSPFTNYNSTIRAEVDSAGIYRITHWRTTILEFDKNTGRILFLQVGYISQTTSALVGRILRALPRQAVEDYFPHIPKHDFKRVRGMLGIR